MQRLVWIVAAMVGLTISVVSAQVTLADGPNTATGSIGTVQVGGGLVRQADAGLDIADSDLSVGLDGSSGAGGNTASDSIGTVQVGSGANTAQDSVGTVQVGSVLEHADLEADVANIHLDTSLSGSDGSSNMAQDSIGTVQVGGGSNMAEDSIGTVQVGKVLPDISISIGDDAGGPLPGTSPGSEPPAGPPSAGAPPDDEPSVGPELPGTPPRSGLPGGEPLGPPLVGIPPFDNEPSMLPPFGSMPPDDGLTSAPQIPGMLGAPVDDIGSGGRHGLTLSAPTILVRRSGRISTDGARSHRR